MRRGNELGEQIIVKRRTKRGHEVLHSGAWKVAFADFTLAMMALFMVLWIIQPRLTKSVWPSRAMVMKPCSTAGPVFLMV